ncbi:MAG: tetratricopeptide repeat protein [Planctomycetes bacterium]|nr:tetratricopeptide repeat protein [Planctomycetota bacterium]
MFVRFTTRGILAAIATLSVNITPLHAAPDDPAPEKPVTSSADSVDKASPDSESTESKSPKPQRTDSDPESQLWAEEAIGRYEQLLERRPFHKSAFTGLVRSYVEKGEIADLVKRYEDIVAAMPDSTASKIVLSRLYLRAGQAEKAADLLAQIEALPKTLARDKSKWSSYRAEVFQRVGKLELAKQVLVDGFTEARTTADRMRFAEALADLHVRNGEKDRAAEVLTKLADQFSDQYLHRKRIANALAHRNLHDAAIAQYRSILKLPSLQTDERCESLRDLGRALESVDRNNDAISVYTEALGLLSASHWLQEELHARIVHLYRASGRMDELVTYCRQQIERSPEQIASRTMLADVFAALGKMDEAKQTLVDAIRLFPKDRSLSRELIQLLERTNNESEVAAEYERVITQHADDVELYIEYGQFLAAHKQLDAARSQWKHVLRTKVADTGLAQRLGNLFEAYEQYDDAVECYQRAIELNPRRPEGYTALAQLYFVQDNREEAVKTLKRMTDANALDSAMQYAACQAYLGLGFNDEALAAIERATQLLPENSDYALVHSNLLVRSGRLDDALAVRHAALDKMQNAVQRSRELNVIVSMYASAGMLEKLRRSEEQALQSDPESANSLMLLARAADFERNFVDAKKWLDRLIEVDPSHEEARRQLAKLQEALGDIDAATEQYQRLIELYPNRARICYQAIADIKLRYNDRAGAIKTFEQMVQRSSDNATVLKDVAEQLVRLGEFDKGIANYELSLKLQPDRHDIRLEYAKALVEAGRLEDGLKMFKAAALQRSDRETALEALTLLHETAQRIGSLPEMIDELQAQLDIDPTDTLIARTLATIFINEFEYQRAMELLDLVLRYRPRDAELQLTRAELLRRLARFDDAIESYRKILQVPEIDRDYVLGELGKTHFEAGQLDEARRNWRRVGHKLYASSLLRNNGLLEDAIDVLEEGIRVKPDDFGLHRSLVRTLQEAGQTDNALEAARRLLDLEPDNVMNIRRLATAYVDRGKRDDAAEVASRLFSAGVAEKNKNRSTNKRSMMGASVMAASMYSAWGSAAFGRGMRRNNLDSAIGFFQENGLVAELEDILNQQLAAQPDNAMLREVSVELFAQPFGKPAVALKLLHELEDATFPLEHQKWLGQCSQRDYYRVKQYQLIARLPALRDSRLATLDSKDATNLNRDEIIEFAVIRNAQGKRDKAIDMLQRAVDADAKDIVALTALVDMLVLAEQFADAEPYVQKAVAILDEQREKQRAEMIQRVRRDFVRTLPMHLQLRVTEDLLIEIANKWTLGQNFYGAYMGGIQTMGYNRAQLTLATVYAKTNRMDKARAIWSLLAPKHPADVDGWTSLAGVAQLHDQQDLAFEYYSNALAAAKELVGDQLLQRIYGNTLGRSWYGSEDAIDSTFNKIVEAFAAHDRLIDLYDFLRETDQVAKARRIAQKYELYDELKALYATRLDAARTVFSRASNDPLNESVALFSQACKLAELHDVTGDWGQAQRIYEAYLEDFPDELGLLITLGEVAERVNDYELAIKWEKQVVAAKERLLRQARAWTMRNLALTPAMPQIIEGVGGSKWTWMSRWGRNRWWGYGQQRELDIAPSWMRIAQLYIAVDNPIAAGDAMERAIAAAPHDRERLGKQVLALIRQRRLVPKMLSVLRGLAVHMPTNEQVQIAFAESLEANDRPGVAVEVYRRLLRRGVSDVGTLGKVKQKLAALAPDSERVATTTIADLEAAVAADPKNSTSRLRLARAFYYALRIDDAHRVLSDLLETAPHLEGVHDLLIEIYTLQGDSERLIEALRTKIERVTNARKRTKTRERLVKELLRKGDVEETLIALKESVDPKNPQSYERVAFLLYYFGHHEDAVEQYEIATRSQAKGRWQGDRGGQMLARVLALKGDMEAAADKVLESVDQQMRQNVQQGGMFAMYSMFNNDQNAFQAFVPLFVIHPAITKAIQEKLEARRTADPDDALATKILIQYCQSTGLTDRANQLIEESIQKGTMDQKLVSSLIDRAISKRDFDKAIELAKEFISQQTKPQLPPGMPAQFAGMMSVMSPRTLMLCKLGDIYWKSNRPDEAFETYGQIVDENVDESRIAYATICLLRGRVDEARSIIEAALADKEVKPPSLLQFSVILAAIDNQPTKAFDVLTEIVENGEGAQSNPFAFGDSGSKVNLLASFATATDQIDRFVEFMLKKRIKKNPNNWTDYKVLVETLLGAGQRSKALEILEKAAENKALRTDALKQRAQLLEGYASPGELIPVYREWLELAENKVQSASVLGQFFGNRRSQGATQTQKQRNRLGDLLWQSGEPEAAEEVWAERLDLNTANGHVRLGQQFLAHHAYEKAANAFRKAAKLEPDNLEAHQAIAKLATERAQSGEAAHHLTQVFLKRYQPSPAAEDADDADPFSMSWSISQRNQQRRGADSQMRSWAYILSAKGTPNDETSDASDADQRLMIATLTGEWPTVEAELKKRLEEAPYDPMVWTLWAIIHERKGDWATAVEARERVRSLAETTIAQHREQLELVLAGKQIKDASAGTREEDANATNAQNRSFRNYNYSGMNNYGWYGNTARSETQRLAALYVELEQYQKAEQLYLLDRRSGGQNALPSIAALMWRQGAQKRAIELMRIGITLGGNTRQMGQYATMLSESGELDAAIALLQRAFQFVPQSNTRMAMYYGGFGSPQVGAQAFESGEEKRFSKPLYQMLQQSNRLDAVIDDLVRQRTDRPNDLRVAKLVVSLQLQDRRWNDARQSLAIWRTSQPQDMSALWQEMQVLAELDDWPAALANVNAMEELAPERSDQWSIVKAFIMLMQQDRAGAVKAVSPLLEESHDTNPGQVQQLCAILACAREHERLRTYLSRLYARDLLAAETIHLLIRVEQIVGHHDRSIQIALDQVWLDPDPLKPASPWMSSLASAESDSRSQASKEPTKQQSSASRALMTTIHEGPAAGATAFKKILEKESDNINALRGLVFASEQAGDLAGSITANKSLLDLLAARRAEIWHASKKRSLSEMVYSILERSKRDGLDTTMVLSMSMSLSNVLSQQLQEAQSASIQRTYEELWTGYQLLHADLLARAKMESELQETLIAQSSLAKAENHQFDSNNQQNYYSNPFGGQSYQRRMRSYGQRESLRTEWRTVLRDELYGLRQFRSLMGAYDRLETEPPVVEWPRLAEAHAVLGNRAEAQKWRQRIARFKMCDLYAGDRPQGNDMQSSWRYSRIVNEEGISHLRSALRGTSVRCDCSDEDNDSDRPIISGAIDSVYEFALVDPKIEGSLLKLKDVVGPGWEDSQSLRQLLFYHRAKRQYTDIVELIEHVCEFDALLQSSHLRVYLQACYELKDEQRVEKVLTEILKKAAILENEVQLARLMMLRHLEKDEAADALEKSLLDRCQTETPNPSLPDPRIDERYSRSNSITSWSGVRRFRRTPRRFGRNTMMPIRSWGFATRASLGAAVGIPIERALRQNDLTVRKIRRSYVRHRLYAHAARLIDHEIAQAPTLSPQVTAQRLNNKARWLYHANKKDEAATAALEAEAHWQNQINGDSSNSRVYWELSQLYASKAYGEDYKKALEALRTARALNRTIDASRITEAQFLFELKEFDEAWNLYQVALNSGKMPLSDSILYQAGLAAVRTEQSDEGKSLLRLALWRAPFNKLAPDAREMIHE